MTASKTVIVLALLALGAGCDDGGATSDNRPAPAAPAATATATAAAVPTAELPPGVLLADAPAGAKDVLAVRKEAKDGDEVVVRGRVGGDAKPFADGRAIVRLVDASIKSCAEMADDACPTPWDYCCEADVSKSSLSVQVVGADGKPLKGSLAGVSGMAGLSEVTFRGKVKRAEGSDAVVVDATSLYVKK